VRRTAASDELGEERAELLDVRKSFVSQHRSLDASGQASAALPSKVLS
jgi:hypothetical protein